MSTRYCVGMNPRRTRREALGLTQADAATRASLSLATWRRWEENPDKVSAATRIACERILDQDAALKAALATEAENFERAWGDCLHLTPRQASAITYSLSWWSDAEISEWLRDPTGEPLHAVSPFDQLDLRVMVVVNDNRAWAAKARERCDAVAAEIENGVLPFDRPGCYFDELLMALALGDAEERLSDMPELFEGIPGRTVADPEGDWTLDSDWEAVSEAFDDRCRWDDWEVPLYKDHSLLSAVLNERHPYSWFDPGEGTAPGYLQRLRGLVIDESAE